MNTLIGDLEEKWFNESSDELAYVLMSERIKL